MKNNSLTELWEKRSKKYLYKVEGVLPKSFPLIANNYLHGWMCEEITKTFKGSSKQIKVLDLGCGYGRLSKYILHSFKQSKTFGLDISPTYVKLYNQELKPRGYAQVGDIAFLPYDNDSFDGVVMVTALMYLTSKRDQEKALKEIFRVLKPGGRFIFIERNPVGHKLITLGGIASIIRGKKNKEIKSVSFTKEYLSKMITEKGGTVKQVEGIPVFTIFFPFIFVLSKISPAWSKYLLTLIKKLDEKFFWLLTPSLYISYIGY
jgi:ubiquinone/menaquinone biosynthesis C-methylase UbiE